MTRQDGDGIFSLDTFQNQAAYTTGSAGGSSEVMSVLMTSPRRRGFQRSLLAQPVLADRRRGQDAGSTRVCAL